MHRFTFVVFWSIAPLCSLAGDPITIWPDLAPGETTRLTGTLQPFRKNEKPPVSRVENVTLPTMTFHPAEKPNGWSVVIFPGGGFGKVVPDKEGSEMATILNKSGVSAFVLTYRTRSKADKNGWMKPLQDGQRAIAFVRANAKKWKLQKDKIGLIGFSAGGNVAARLLCSENVKAYRPVDAIDKTSHRPDFAMLIYPWNIYEPQNGTLVDDMRVPKSCPPTFIVHTDDDRATSLGSVMFYVGLKKNNIHSALHVYANGGHGYGTRPVKNSQIGNWAAESVKWLETLK